MIVVAGPSTLQNTSWFSELSRLPRSTTITGRLAVLTSERDDRLSRTGEQALERA